MSSVKISNNMLERMPVYLNYLNALPKSITNISATKIAKALGLGEVSVRKDLAKVSDGGRCKLGYRCEDLINDIENFLDVKSKINAVIVGDGELIKILLNYQGAENSGLNILAGFDSSCTKQWNSGEKMIYPLEQLESFCTDQDINIGVIMSPIKEAQEVCDRLVRLGAKAIWNFTPVHLNVPEHIVVQSENITASIIKMRMQLKEKAEVS